VSRDRQHSPPLSKPFAASIQATFQQSPAYTLTGFHNAIALTRDTAEVHYDRGIALKDLNRFADALACFDKALALKPDYAEAYNSRGIVLAAVKRFDEALSCFDKAIALKSDYAGAHNNCGIVLQDLGRMDDALASFDKAIVLEPDNAAAHNNRGAVLQDLKRFDDALAAFDKAMALKPDYAAAHFNRGIVLQELKRLDGALASYDKAIALKPNSALYINRGIVLQDLRRFDDALASYDKATALKPDYAEAYNNKAICLLQMGRFEQGWQLHEWRKKIEEPVGNRSFPKALWLGNENISNKTLFVHWEQGFGDTIQFCRYSKLLKARGARVEMSVQQPLYKLLQQMSPDIKIIRHDEVPAEFDYHCPLMSLPLALGTKLETIPSEKYYILADAQLRKVWDARLPPPTKPRRGVVWSGNTKQKNDRNRSIDLATLAPLFSADAHWISLQKDLRLGDSALLRELNQIVCYGDEVKDFSDTAAVIDLLDLVITVDTSVAHLAGAMGKQVWILLTYNPDWRWLLDRSDTPWYPSARLFRQDHTRSWENVVGSVHAALRDFVQHRP
jgi:tetratricopeptide (TPR) repeat protein